MSTHHPAIFIDGNIHKAVSRKAGDPKLYYFPNGTYVPGVSTTFAFKPEMRYCELHSLPVHVYTILPHAPLVDERTSKAERDHVDAFRKTLGSTEFNNSEFDYS
jgi:hypothetical protein